MDGALLPSDDHGDNEWMAEVKASRSIRAGLVAVAFALLMSIAAGVQPASAAVPGATFTETGCEGSSDSVARLYTAGLGRPPELDGFEFWLGEYTSGRQTFSSMADFFVRSPEFQASYGTLTDQAFVERLYLNVLGRPGEPDGVTFWTGQIVSGLSRATILMRFAESPENIANSGTAQPDLGPFNEGRPVPWTCVGWQPTGEAPATQPSCTIVGRNSIDSVEFRLEMTNPTAGRASARVRIAGLIDGVRRDDQFTGASYVEAGQTVEQDSILLDDVFDAAPLESITCEILTVDWDADPGVTIVDGGCTLQELNSIDTWEIELGAVNPLQVEGDARLVILPYLDGRRVDSQFSSLDNVAPGEAAFRQSIILSDRIDGIARDRVRCELLVLEWEPSD